MQNASSPLTPDSSFRFKKMASKTAFRSHDSLLIHAFQPDVRRTLFSHREADLHDPTRREVWAFER